MKKHILQLFYIALVAVLIFSFFYYELNTIFSIDNINNVKSYFLELGNVAVIHMIIIYILFNIAAIPRVFFTIFSGYIFGVFYGFLFAWIATMVGLIVTFISVRYLFREKFNNKFGEKKIIEKLNIQIEKRGFILVAFLRAIYIVPSSILNYSFGFTKIKTSNYIFASALGFIPVVFINVYSGYLIEKSISNPINITLLVSVSVLLLILFFLLKKKAISFVQNIIN